MSPQRVADAASISPYPFVVRQERQLSGASPENTEHTRPPKGKKAKAKAPRAERNPRQEEEPRFNIGAPRPPRPPQSSRGGRRGFPFSGRSYAADQNGIPDYPPPSFQEAINTPPLSVSSSTVSLVHANPLPLVIPEDILENPLEAENSNRDAAAAPSEPSGPAEPTAAAASPDAADDNASDSGESMFIIDRNSVPVCSSDLPPEVFKKRVRTDYFSRHGVEFPGQSSSESKRASGDADATSRGRRGLRPPPLDISSKINLLSQGGSSPVSTPKRRFLSLSPLKTMFPTKSSVHQERAMSAHPSPSPSTSPYSMSRSTFFRSTSSLATSLLPTLSSNHSLSRKIFSSRNKDRNRPNSEDFGTWEVVDEETCIGVDSEGVEHPTSLMSAVASIRNLRDQGTSPTRSQSFTVGTHVPHSAPATTQTHYQVSLSRETIRPTSESSLRDWKGSTAFIDRPVNRHPSPASPSMVSIVSGTNTLPSAPMSTIDLSLPLTPSPILASVRGRTSAPSQGSPAPSLAYTRTAHVIHSSPLRVDARPTITIENQVVGDVYEKALETPLPATPDYHSQFEIAPVSGSSAHIPGSRVADLMAGSAADSISDCIPVLDAPFLSRTSPQVTTTIVQQPLSTSSSTSSVPLDLISKTDSLEEPMTPTRHHYAGRPLPRPPPIAGRVGTIDSTYASVEEPSRVGDQSSHLLNPCPEGLLIDLDDTTLDDIPASGISTPRSEEVPFYSTHHLPMMSRNTSSVDLIAPDTLGTFTSERGTNTPLRSASAGPSQLPPGGGFSELTDLDLLVSGLADRDHDGSDYEVSCSNNGWREHGLNGSKQPDATSSLRVNWACEPISNTRAGLRLGHLPETYSQPQRQHISHWAH